MKPAAHPCWLAMERVAEDESDEKDGDEEPVPPVSGRASSSSS